MKRNLSIAAKFALVSLAYTIPIAILLNFFVTEKNRIINSTNLELAGSAYLRPTLSLLAHSNQYRQLLAINKKAKLDEKQLVDVKNLIAKDFEDLTSQQNLAGETLLVNASELAKRTRENSHPDKLAETWKAIDSETKPDLVDQELLAFTSHVKGLVEQVGDTSGLILDPDLDSFYLMNSVVVEFSAIFNQFSDLIVDAVKVVGLKNSTLSDIAQIEIASAGLDSYLAALNRSTKTAITENGHTVAPNSVLQSDVAKKFTEYSATANKSSKDIREKFEQHQLSLPMLIDAIKVASAGLDQMVLHQNSLDEILNLRVDNYQSSKQQALFWLLGVWLFTCALGYSLQRSVVTSIKQILASLKQTADQTSLNSSKLLDSSQKSAAAATQEAAAIQESVAAMSEITSMLMQTASHTESASHAAKSALDNTANGSHIMQDMGRSMNDISASNVRLKDISKIIDDIAARTNVINDIVFKTQLLAVNASIEAARAGHHGKGFSVVANEVGNLASMSGEAAKEIRQLLNTSRLQVAEIVEMTTTSVKKGQQVSREADETFKLISEDVTNIHEKVQQIFDATKEQEIGVRQTSEAMTQLNEATTVNNAMAQENVQIGQTILDQSHHIENISRAMSYVVLGKIANDQNNTSAGVLADGVGVSPLDLVKRENGESARTPKLKVNEASSQFSNVARERDHSSTQQGQSRKELLAAKIVRRASGNTAAAKSQSPKGVKFNWDPSFDIGVDSMNNEHKKLLKLMSDLEDAYSSGKNAKVLGDILQDLGEYTTKHFADEEAFMLSIKYPDLETHKHIHKTLLDRFNGFVLQFKMEGKLTDEFFGFLRAWLTAHIMGIDIKYGKFANLHKKAS